MAKKELVKKAETQNLPTLQHSSLNNAMAIATEMSKSDIIPKEFQNKPANCFIVVQLANRLKADPFMVLQNTHVIYGKPAIASSFIIACINGSGKLKGSLKFKLDESESKCFAWGIEAATGEKLIGPVVSLEMAKAEGWIAKNGSKWKTMPGIMLRYRAASFFGRLQCPEILSGIYSTEEVEEMQTPTSETESIIDVFAEPEAPKEEPQKQIEEKPTETIQDDTDSIPQEFIDRANAYYEEELENEANG